jgi:YidC/Oxa1 family membrane protein insertase
LSILDPINDLVAWVIMHIYNVLGPVFGPTSGVTWVLSIAALVVAMRLIMLPLFIKQMHTQRAMTALTPRITELRKKYKGDKERLNQETMKLYQEAGVNPLMGCLPVLLQMPLFFALFSVLRNIAEYGSPKVQLLYHLKKSFVVNVSKADIFGVKIKDTFLHGTSIHVHIVVAIVVLISMGTTYLTVRQSMKRGMMPTGSDNPMGQSQKLMAYVMPLFALTGLYWPFGLVLYWVLTNLWTLGQQFVLLRKYPVGAAAAAVGGNLPIGRSGKPATALGLTGGSGRTRPSTGGGASPGKKTSSPGKTAEPISDSVPADSKGVADGDGPVADAVPDGAVSANGHASPSGKRPAGAKPAGPGSGKSAGSGSGKPAGSGAAKPAGARKATTGAAAAAGRPPANGARGARGPAAVGREAKAVSGTGAANGHSPAGEGGVLRRFARNRPEPEPPAVIEPETKIVRHQPQRQSKSKRSGKR